MSDGLQALVLAAGSARRFGGRKLLADWNGATLLHAALACARAAPVEGVTVVTGADAADITACVRAFDPAIRLVHAPDHAEGMAASLRAGVASLPAETRASFVFLGDMPRVSAALIDRLLAAFDPAAGRRIVAPSRDGQVGNPVLWSRELFDEMSGVTGDVGARHLIRTHASSVTELTVDDDAALVDISGAVTHIKAGKVRALAVTSDKRHFQVPEVPTVQEQDLLHGRFILLGRGKRNHHLVGIDR